MKTTNIIVGLLALLGHSALLAQDTLTFDIDEIQWTEPGELPVRVQNFDGIIAFQYTIVWDANAITLDSVGNFNLDGLTHNLFNLDNSADGELTLAWDDVSLNGITVADGSPVFSLYFTPTPEALDSNLVQFGDEPTAPVAVRFEDGDVVEYEPGLVGGVVEVLPPLAILTVNQTTALDCAGDNNGFISIEMEGGLAPYTFFWNGIPGPDSLPNLAAGNYELVIVDAFNDSLTTNFLITEPAALEISSEVIMPTCLEENNGAIEVEVAGGTAPYEYAWSNDLTTEDIDQLSGGDYELEITDANGCILTHNFEVPAVTIDVISTVTHPTCSGSNDGTIQLMATGDYSYEWNDGSASAQLADLPAGAYEVSVSTAKGCSTTYSFQLEEPDPVMVFAQNSPNVTCAGGSDGTIELAAEGGTGEYTYFYAETTTPLEPPILDNLAAGTYFFYAIDSNGCESPVTEIVVEDAEAIEVTGSTVDLLCNGVPTGMVSLEVNGGAGGFSYEWNNGATTTAIENLAAGEYTVVVEDAIGCQTSASFVVEEPAPIVVTPAFVSPSCDGIAPGSISLQVEGGVGDLVFDWSNGMSGAVINGLAAGTYMVSIEDANGCEVVESITLEAPPPIEANVLINYGCGEGTIGLNAIALQGTPPYTYTWSTGDETKQIFGLSGGTYTVSITDSEGCTGAETVEVDAVPYLDIASDRQNVTCAGGANGSIDLTVTGSIPPYAYQWSDGSTEEDRSGLAVGQYGVSVSSASGCNFSLSFQINAPPPIMITLDTTAFANGTWSARAIPSGGVPPYEISWSTGATGNEVDGLLMGEYVVTITDGNDCIYTETFVLGVVSTSVQQLQVDWRVFPNPSNNWVFIEVENVPVNGGDLIVFDTRGRKVVQRPFQGPQQELNVEGLPPGIYWLQLRTATGWGNKKLVVE